MSNIVNTNGTTGIRFGVISAQSLDDDLVQELFFGAQAVDCVYEDAYKETKAELGAEWDNKLEEAEIAASEVDPNMGELERERFIERWFQVSETSDDRDTYIERGLERFSDMFESDATHIEGTYEGVKYMITSLGGAHLVWAIEGPEGACNSLCSPCVPNAGDLDSGFTLDSEIPLMSDGYPERDQEGYPCYCVPRDWLRANDE